MRIQDQTLVVLCLAKNPGPSREESGCIVDGLVYRAHIRFGFLERCVDAFDHFVDFAHSFQLGLQARTTRGLALPLLGGTPAVGASPLPSGSTREAVLLGDPRAGGTVLVVLPEGVVRPAAPLGPQRRA